MWKLPEWTDWQWLDESSATFLRTVSTEWPDMFFSSATSSYLEPNFFKHKKKKKKREKDRWMRIKGIEVSDNVLSYWYGSASES